MSDFQLPNSGSMSLHIYIYLKWKQSDGITLPLTTLQGKQNK